MSSDDKDEGGIVLGGISFGVSGGTSKDTSATVTATPGASGAKQAAPVELGDALLPLRVLVVADLLPHAEHNAGAHAPEDATPIEPGDLDGLFRRLAPRLAIEVESVLAEGKRVRVDFAPTAMKSFRPDSMVREIPLLRSLLDGLAVLERLRDGTASVEMARGELARLWSGSSFVDRVLGGVETRKAAQAPAPASTAGDPSVDRLLDMVDTGGSAGSEPAAPLPTQPQKGRFDAFLAAVATSGKRSSGANPAEAVRLVEKALGVQLGAILQHPELRRLEAAWRGLELLARRMSKKAMRVEVLASEPGAMADTLARGIVAGAGIAPPVSLAVVDHAFGGDAASLARLRAIAEIAEAHTVPVITNAAPALLGHDDLDSIDRLDNKQALFDAPERAPWRAEAHRPAMLWTVLALNRVLARTAYDARSSRVRQVQVAEMPADEASAAVWIQPCWAVAALTLQSFDKTGWPCRVTGARDGGMLEDLPVREKDVPGSHEKVAIPTEAFFSTETQRSLARIGILALAAQPNSDTTYLLTAPTSYVPPPKRTYDSETTEPEVRLPQASLVDQLFVARLAQYLRALGARISPTEAPEDVQAFFRAALWELFEGARPGSVELDVSVAATDAGLSADVTVRPRRFLGVTMEEISLGVPIG